MKLSAREKEKTEKIFNKFYKLQKKMFKPINCKIVPLDSGKIYIIEKRKEG